MRWFRSYEWKSDRYFPGGKVVYEPIPNQDRYLVKYIHPKATFSRGIISHYELTVQGDDGYQMKLRIIRWLSDNGLQRLSEKLCTHSYGVVWYTVYKFEPDMTCRGCGMDLG